MRLSRERQKKDESNQGGNDARHDDDSALTDFLASLIDYTPSV